MSSLTPSQLFLDSLINGRYYPCNKIIAARTAAPSIGWAVLTGAANPTDDVLVSVVVVVSAEGAGLDVTVLRVSDRVLMTDD